MTSPYNSVTLEKAHKTDSVVITYLKRSFLILMKVIGFDILYNVMF